MSKEHKIAQLLTKSKSTLALAESCSGGLLAHRITNIPGSSHFLKLGLVTYSNEAKMKLLKLPSKLLSSYGAVSEPVACAMAKSVRTLAKTDYGISITGIAGPSGGSKTKPVGLTFIAISTKDELLCLKCLFKGTRASIKKQTTTQALKSLLEFLT